MPRVRKLGVDKQYSYLKECIEAMRKSEKITKIELNAIARGKADSKSSNIYNRFRNPDTFTLGELRNIAKFFGVNLKVEFVEKNQ